MTLLNEKAPEFTLENENGEQVSLSDFRGKNVVLYFYPKDMTPGCTTQAYEIHRKAWPAFFAACRYGP